VHFRRQSRERGKSGGSEASPYPDRVLAAGLSGHAIILASEPVSGRHRNLVTPGPTRDSLRR
jgi:hypothetical protein